MSDFIVWLFASDDPTARLLTAFLLACCITLLVLEVRFRRAS